MKKNSFLFVIVATVLIFSGCGYSSRALSPFLSAKETIYIPAFENAINYAAETRNRSVYVPMLEVNITNEVINRFVFDGNLKVARQEESDLVLTGKLLGFRRDILRYDDNIDAEEYRVRITVSLTLWDNDTQTQVWAEPSFVGDATYFVVGPNATSESAAIDEAIKDLAKRIVDRTIEDW